MSGASAPWGDQTGSTKPAGAVPADRVILTGEDDLAPARGLVAALLLSVPLWAGIVLGLMR